MSKRYFQRSLESEYWCWDDDVKRGYWVLASNGEFNGESSYTFGEGSGLGGVEVFPEWAKEKPVEEYELLKVGDVIQEGDEYQGDGIGVWYDAGFAAGTKLEPKHVPHRRRKKTIPTKDSNPKDAIGVTKPPINNVPRSVLSEVGMALAEGQWKYGGYNWRAVGVRASVYLDALDRHMTAWWEGEDLDPDSGLSHITKAISALMVLRDGMIQENWVDDRPPKSKMDRQQLAAQYKGMLERLKSMQPEPAKGYTEKEL